MNENQEPIEPQEEIKVEELNIGEIENEIPETPKKKREVEYFTDEMHKNIYPFQEPYRGGNGGSRPSRDTAKISIEK